MSLRPSRTSATAIALVFSTLMTGVALAEPVHDVDLVGIDASVKPGDDFYRYANGTWITSAEIPADRSSYGPSAVLVEKTSEQVRALIQDAAAGNAPAGSNAQKVGDYYAAFMDEAAIETKGLQPLAAEFAAIDAITDKAGLATYFGSHLRADVDALNATDLYTDNLFGFWAQQGFEAPERVVAYLMQGGLGMPDRDYYVDPSEKMAALRTRYQQHIVTMLTLANVPDAEARAAQIMALETDIAKNHATRLDTSDVSKANNPWTRDQFAVKAPGLDWDAYFKAAGLSGQNDFIVWQPSAIAGSSALVASQPLDIWKVYLRYRLLDHYAQVLPKSFYDEVFSFYGTALQGTPKMRDRWKRAISATNGALGEAVGQLYVERHFPPQAKAKIQAMVDNEIAAYRVRMEKLDWMSPETKAKALAKLGTLKVGVGYPDRWIDYSGQEVVRGDAVGNMQRAERFNYERNLAKLGKAPDHYEWVMTPQTVNAVNLPMANALNFPAAILQPPYFDPEADSAFNYGGIGATIGHEISHSFDDMGAMFDDKGRLINWWTAEDLKHFKAAGAALARQYDAYCPFTDLCLNGELVLSENIADVAGLAAAYDAYKMSLGGKPDVVKNGLTGDQRFFIAFAQSWRDKTREAALRQQILTDGHAPDEYRGDTVRNLDAWYEAFKVTPDQRQYLKPEDRVQVW
ncbi:peptidase family M13 family protein [Asticcacaulis biprosthecium C19]|uniref:Peptidase family M13 family protein n=1 Tax=Asticcacaulis biprosthecium C19 TaxID=715226 RepID=F4QUB2_9CAUL|nr:M13 family metallopeptidase [Asticcacaulis biprosthecium]EGF89412.1 peptidase family M13 family protein [Asticcacaulis biprosthecium C19]